MKTLRNILAVGMVFVGGAYAEKLTDITLGLDVPVAVTVTPPCAGCPDGTNYKTLEEAKKHCADKAFSGFELQAAGGRVSCQRISKIIN